MATSAGHLQPDCISTLANTRKGRFFLRGYRDRYVSSNGLLASAKGSRLEAVNDLKELDFWLILFYLFMEYIVCLS